MNDLLLELAAMAKRFSEIYEDSDSGLCGIGWSFDGPYVHLTESVFKREFQEHMTKERPVTQNREIFTIMDGVRFFSLERENKEN